MKYVFGFSVLFSLAMAIVTPHPLCYWCAVLAVGGFLNGIVLATNAWKMPVVGMCEAGPRHQPMTPETRFRWLGDVIPTGLGRASLGDFAICAGILGIAANRGQVTLGMALVVAWLLPWASGCSGGFRLFDKWSREERRDARKNIPIVLTLLIIGNLLHVHGCSTPELAASVESAASAVMPEKKIFPPKTRLLTKLATTQLSPPPFEVLKRLRQEDAEREQKAVKQQANDAVENFVKANTLFTVTESNKRKGTPCRVTCLVHHNSTYDVETLPELCRANQIPQNTEYVPGWWPLGDKYEATEAWPGPATKGFHSYKLYWK